MVPHVKIQKGDTVYLLIRYGDRFRFVTVNERLTEAMERHILSAPCEDSELDMLRLSYEPLPVKDVWSYAMSDTEQGSGLVLYVKNEIYTYRFHEGSSAEEMAAVLEGIGKFGEVEPPVEPYYAPMEDWRLARQKPWMLRLLKPFTYCWNVFAVVCATASILWGKTVPLPVILCILIYPLSLLLYLLLPQYFSFLDKESYEKHGYTAPVEQWYIYLSLLAPAWALFERWCDFRILNGLLGLIACLFTIAFPVVLRWLSREARQHFFVVFLLTIFTLLYSLGTLGLLNYYLDSEKQPQPYEVAGLYTGRYSHNCYVWEGDRRINLPLTRRYYQILQQGDTILVIHSEGFFGVEYACVVEKLE